ncbi:type 1 glutamine amidotransferase [Pseudonocardia asaccharolytica]|uniref:Glutamine amidotransferase n=1 Tax=Pseudonocardia asaccharolytica DSM 44247 = NBRC 16224 TaxID=1123024 RepID=A0A511D383_9PSEU|nr:type 1 glutamine amidotransferase [Pseudonocardia asaccharolytica]GEL17368.1 glutamine amidotransferase [Pseudonocardia asaccharolytica DSM 44247 = NBRC 16224]
MGDIRVLFIEHQDDCPPGYVGERAAELGFGVEVVRARDGRLPDPREFSLVVPLGSADAAYDDTLSYLEAEHALLATAVEAGVPVLGICFGAQLLARVLGGTVAPLPSGPEIGWLRIDTTEPELVAPGPWLVWHLDGMTCPPGATAIAHTAAGLQAFRHGPHLGVQFHPEALPASADSWARSYAATLVALGIDAAELAARTRALQGDARVRAHELFDRFCARSFGYAPVEASSWPTTTIATPPARTR